MVKQHYRNAEMPLTRRDCSSEGILGRIKAFQIKAEKVKQWPDRGPQDYEGK